MKTGKIPQYGAAVTPYLVVNDVDEALAFYEKAFGLTVRMKMPGPNGKTMHAELMHGDSPIMVGCPMGEMGCSAPTNSPNTSLSLYLYVEDVDRLYAQALAAGATSKSACKDQFYGDRTCGLIDPFGHHWGFGTHIKNMTPEEMNAAFKEMAKV